MSKDYDITSAMEKVENELISSMIRNFGLHREAEKYQLFKWNMWQAEQLKALDIYKRRNAKRLRAEFKGLNKKVEDFIREAKNKGGFDEEIKILKAIKKGYKFRGTKQAMTADFFRVNEAKLNALIKATVSDMEKAEIAILRRSNDAYRKAIFNAQVYANTGAGTYKKAVDMATKDMLSAGLKCVTYANGSMHTLSDYAEMAIRTAAKRAYLQGAGEKRQEWGIATVIVNKRGGACPKCMPFVGKVMIDDVWSGGDKNDGRYPLMSTAISKGLYHPNCRDSHTTFFEGISKEESKYTKEELAQIDENYANEQKEKYVKRQVEKYDRLSKNSLDEENKKKYKARKEEWQNRLKSIKNSTSNTKNEEKKYVVENSAKSDIIDVKEPKFVDIVPNELAKGKGEKIPPKADDTIELKKKISDANTEISDLKKQFSEITDGYSYDDWFKDFTSIEDGFGEISEEDKPNASRLEAISQKLDELNENKRYWKAQLPKRKQLDTGYKGSVPDEELESYNKRAYEQIKKDTGYNDGDTSKLQNAFINYFGGNYDAILSGQAGMAEIIKTGIEVMPAYDGKIYRGMIFTKEEIKIFSELKEGDVIPNKGIISSWSSNERVSISFCGVNSYERSSVILECVDNQTGVGVQHISKFGSGEAEVLSSSAYEVIEVSIQNKYDYLSEHKEFLWFPQDLEEEKMAMEENIVCRIKVREKMN